MKQIGFIKTLTEFERLYQKKIFTTAELAVFANLSKANVSMTLARAEKDGVVFRVGHYWVNHLSPPSLFELGLCIKVPTYMSLESALYYHGVLSQSPRLGLTLMTMGRPISYETPIGVLHYHHLKKELFSDYDEKRIALPEKAILDLVYLRKKQGLSPLFTETIYFDLLKINKLKKLSKKYPDWVWQAVFNFHASFANNK